MSVLDEEFIFEQFVPRRREDVFEFFSRPENLEAITPPWLNFRIVGKTSPEVAQATLIDYRLRIRGVAVGWRTLIADWTPPHRFVDVQLKGPYTKWEHTHEFKEVPGGTLMTDRVIYRLPLGRLGQFIAGRMVRTDVEAIFAFRKKRISELLDS